MAGLHSGQVHYYDVARLTKTQEYSTAQDMNIACCTFRNNYHMSVGSKSQKIYHFDNRSCQPVGESIQA